MASLVLPPSSLAGSSSLAASEDPDPDYDRLDGTGASGKKVNVIEWEGNLEVHVYPAGSLKGLALQLDKKNKNKPVMVIGYRFDSQPDKQLIRRAILGIDLREGFKAYRDPSAGDYDKIVITNNGLGSPLALFKLEPAPTQLYPEGHPALAKTDTEKKTRDPASKHRAKARSDDARPGGPDQETGGIQPFFSDN
jgi:hypothetical protein